MRPIGKLLGLAALTAAITMPAFAQTPEDFKPYKENNLRLPSVPVIVNDPFFSIWSNYNELNGGPTRHWSEREKAIDGILRVDGIAYRFMGQEKKNLLAPIHPMTIDGPGWEGTVSHTRQTNLDWTKADFDDSSWSKEQAAWGTPNEYPNVHNTWKDENSDIYVRREIDLTADDIAQDLWVMFSHDDVFEMYINGTRVANTGETWIQGEERQLTAAMKAALKPGRNVMAAHCHNTHGGAYVDFGLYKNLLTEDEEVLQAKQNSVDVMACSSFYNFTCGPVNLDVVFTAPMLIDDLDMISTPINYISYQVKSTDGKKHDVQFYLGTSAQLTVHEMGQPTLSDITKVNGTDYLRAGSEAQPVLERTGDMVAIDWGYLYIPAINGEIAVADPLTTQRTFVTTGKLPASEKEAVRSTNRSTMPTLAFMNDLGSIDEARDFMMIGYDEVWDMQYMHKNYKAYYARDGKTIFQAFEEFRDNYANNMERCRALDKKIYDDALAAGNVKYAEQLAANYRLVMAAHKLFRDDTGKTLYFSKENKSGGFVNTMDLTYPECPIYLLYNIDLQKGMIFSILVYALSDARKGKNCAAHDLGIYPRANGMVYGDSMPLEESANVLILANAICRLTGDGEWLKPYKSVLRTWAEFCRTEGQNPGNQLCTDDFKGPSEQNTNLSVKAIIAVGAYAELLNYIGESVRGDKERYSEAAKNMALIWEGDARDGDHYRMEFHKSGTWSQKYNMLWDVAWGYNLFPAEVLDREIKFYLNKQQKYGLPLDSRDLQTKSDWIFWTASMAPDTETFLKFSDRHWDYMNETTSRIPLSDYYQSHSGVTCNFSGRSVIGGLWMKVLVDRIKPQKEEVAWEPKGNHIKTRWAAEVSPENAHPEYPRPQMAREEWESLNGLWDYAFTTGTAPREEYEGKILVPFPVESSLSGVMRPLEPGYVLWYKREVTIPEEWNGKNIVLNFEAVDYVADVYINGTTTRNRAATHTGGHTAFSVDITRFIDNGVIKDGKFTLYVKATDDTDEGRQPVGKQRRYPDGRGSIWYTSSSGIWQSVWMEPVDKAHLEDLRITPDVDNSTLKFDMAYTGTPTGKVTVTLKDGDNVIESKSVDAAANTSVTFDLATPRLWHPNDPYLYNVTVTLANSDEVADEVNSYAAMRKISYAKNEEGYWRMQLNNKDLFQFGPLDQGYWPDGLLTAPTDEALLYDIEKTKEWGFNMIRKHMKVEPRRWYYHCDRLGMLVWQDMPSQFRGHEGWVTDRYYDDHQCNIDGTVERNFRAEWKEIIEQHYSNPCIVVWTPFNEAWGQFKTAEIVEYTQELDPTRLVNPASGGNHYRLGEGTFVDQHTYDQPIRLQENIFDPSRPMVLGEYGGLGRNINGHRWFERDAQTYNTYNSAAAITTAYTKLAGQIADIAKGYEKDGKKINYCAAVYTQTTDVETEVNGIMTYDREIVKFDEDRLAKATGDLSAVFGNFAGIEAPAADRVNGEPEYYNIMGMRLNGPTPGINIVKDADGTVRKELYRL